MVIIQDVLIMKIFSNKKIIAAVAISGVLIFGGELLRATAIGNSGVNVKVNIEGSINWNKGAYSNITAVGIIRLDPHGLAMAREAAIMAAQRNLVGIVQVMQINSITTMHDLIIADDNVNRRI